MRARKSSASAWTRRRNRRIRGTSRIANDAIADDDEPGTKGDVDISQRPRRSEQTRHRLYRRFALYGGQVESDNGCEEMLEHSTCSGHGERRGARVIGLKMMKVPEEPTSGSPGVIPDRERMTAPGR